MIINYLHTEIRLLFLYIVRLSFLCGGIKTKKMEIVTFSTQDWTEIPKQDNPAFDYIYDDARLQERIVGRRNHCLMICKVLPYQQKVVGKDGFVVIEVPMTGDVIKRGLFWYLEHAELFASALANEA